MKVLIVDEMHPSMVPLLEELNLEVSYFPDFNYSDAFQVIHDYQGLVIRSKFFIDKAFLNQAPSLKFIARAGAGLDLIDLEACKLRDLQVFAANEANKVAVTEHLIGMILNLFNHISKSSAEVKELKWLREENRGEELAGKTVGILGYGNNGSETAKRFEAFGCNVLAYDKYKTDFGSGNIKEASREEIFKNADIFSLHVPLTAETKNMVNADFLSNFNNSIYFCNVARGEIVVQHDLVEALKSGKVKGACLDVLENEKLKMLTEQQREDFYYLTTQPRVIITPHVAGWTKESYEKINQVLAKKIRTFLKV